MPVPIPLMSDTTDPVPLFLDLTFARSLSGPRKMALTFVFVFKVKLQVGLVPQFRDDGDHPSKREPGEGVVRKVIGVLG
jgi:hypothetical protein